MKDIKKPTVLIVHNLYQVPGGEDTVVRNEKTLLEQNGHKVILYTRHNDEIKKFSLLKKIILLFSTLYSFKTYREIKNIIIENNIELMHVHNTLPLISFSSYHAAFACKVPVVQTVHNYRLLCPGATFTRDEKICEICISKGLHNSVMYKCYRNSYIQTLLSAINIKLHRSIGTYKRAHFICFTEFIKNKLLEVNTFNDVINPNHVYIKPHFTTFKSEIKYANERKNQYIFVGRLDKLKGIWILLEAWNKIKDIQLIICGTGPEEMEIREYIEKKGFTNIKLMGFVKNETARDLISESKALIMPSQWYETLPMTFVECFSVATPIIGCDIGNIGDIIIEQKTGVHFEYNSPESLVNAIRLFESLDENELIDNVSRYYDEHFSAEQNYITISNIYSNIISTYKN